MNMYTIGQLNKLQDDATRWAFFALSTPYDASSRAKYAEIVKAFEEFKDYRSAMVKSCRKVDLPNVIRDVAERTLKHVEEQFAAHRRLVDDLRIEPLQSS